MTFTDDDLKRLKESANKKDRPYYDAWEALTVDKINALLARLEAAERIVTWKCRCRFSLQSILSGEHGCARDVLIENWRKAAGR